RRFRSEPEAALASRARVSRGIARKARLRRLVEQSRPECASFLRVRRLELEHDEVPKARLRLALRRDGLSIEQQDIGLQQLGEKGDYAPAVEDDVVLGQRELERGVRAAMNVKAEKARRGQLERRITVALEPCGNVPFLIRLAKTSEIVDAEGDLGVIVDELQRL